MYDVSAQVDKGK